MASVLGRFSFVFFFFLFLSSHGLAAKIDFSEYVRGLPTQAAEQSFMQKLAIMAQQLPPGDGQTARAARNFFLAELAHAPADRVGLERLFWYPGWHDFEHGRADYLAIVLPKLGPAAPSLVTSLVQDLAVPNDGFPSKLVNDLQLDEGNVVEGLRAMVTHSNFDYFAEPLAKNGYDLLAAMVSNGGSSATPEARGDSTPVRRPSGPGKKDPDAPPANEKPEVAPPPSVPGTYRRRAIATARFGDGAKQALLQNARGLKAQIAKAIIGQDRAGQAFQDRLIQYIDHFGSRTKEPIALHLIGLPGVGKSAILDTVEKAGIQVVRIDAQQFQEANQNTINAFYGLLRQVEQLQKKGPVILMVDEIDKIGEVKKLAAGYEEQTNPFIGILNEILTDGRVSPTGSQDRIDLNNTFVVTAMNFSPDEIERFSKHALKAEKNFYEFSVEDFQAFDAWLRETPAAIPMVLSHIFRSNTVSRLAPNTVMVKPLSHEDYRQIVRNKVAKTIAESTKHGAAKSIKADFSDSLVDFFRRQALNPALGARDVVFKTDALVGQLLYFGSKVNGPGKNSLDRPRDLYFDYDPEKGVTIRVTSWVQHGLVLDPQESFEVPIQYDPVSRSFVEPPGMADVPPTRHLRHRDHVERGLTLREIREARFPANTNYIKGLAKQLMRSIFGQDPTAKLLEEELSAYSSRRADDKKPPSFLVLAGFPGIGKSQIVKTAAEVGDFPIARLNMQAYASDDPQSVSNFVAALVDVVRVARKQSKDGKYILLLEELDKVFEVDPQTGHVVNRPVMSIIKDIFDSGIFTTVPTQYNNQVQQIDLRDAFPIVTMNFAVERFGFVADPRLTTIEDMDRAWETLNSRLADRKAVLQSMFLPETVDRIIDRLRILRPLHKPHYQKLIKVQTEAVIEARLHDENGDNVTRIEVKLTPAYRRYLYGESVIPSEGARNTVISVQRMLSRDLESALASIPRDSKLAVLPLTLELDYLPGSSKVVVTASPQEKTRGVQPTVILEKPVVLNFPPIRAKGRLPEERLLVAVHEFGHAFTSVLMGDRFEYATVIPPKKGTGGYVKRSTDSMLAQTLLADIYMTLGSRAMERIFLSADPMKADASVTNTMGGSSDIQQATAALWNFIYEFGFDPAYGTVERIGANYAFFAPVPADKVDSMAKILGDMTTYLVAEMLKAHPKEWYRDRIVEFARAGGMTEKEFYAMIGYTFPGLNKQPVGILSKLQEIFRGKIVEPKSELSAAQKAAHGDNKKTAAQNLQAARDYFLASLLQNMHGDQLGLQRLAASLDTLLPVQLDAGTQTAAPVATKTKAPRKGCRAAEQALAKTKRS